ncbi:MAG: hypothetical protein HC877_23790 [Thioploca sp.]|nr:hypothetical protein [Thioploca sp.]
MGSENAADLFGRIIEPVIRARIQNRLPLILCTNDIDLTRSFSGSLQISIQSLMKMITFVPVPGKDHRGQ